MEKINKSEIVKLFLISALLIITPLLPSSLRTTYLYFVVNLLIIALVAEAGLLSFFSKDAPAYHNHKIPTQKQPPQLITTSSQISDDHQTTMINNTHEEAKNVDEKIKAVGNNINVKKSIEKCPSTPSLFFIGGDAEDHQMAEDDEEEEDDEGEFSGQELFNKAESFIGDFYKQLKMQREESWKRLQDIYHKSF